MLSPKCPLSKAWLDWNPVVSFSFWAQSRPGGSARQQRMKTNRPAARALRFVMRVSPLGSAMVLVCLAYWWDRATRGSHDPLEALEQSWAGLKLSQDRSIHERRPRTSSGIEHGPNAEGQGAVSPSLWLSREGTLQIPGPEGPVPR